MAGEINVSRSRGSSQCSASDGTHPTHKQTQQQRKRYVYHVGTSIKKRALIFYRY